jgi:hypothetical protein
MARSEISNRNLMWQARQTLAALPQKERDALHYAGLGPGDGYIGMWKDGAAACLINFVR